MSAAEYREHLVDYSVEPWGDDAVCRQIGVLTYVVANAFRGKDTPPFPLDLFVPDHGGTRKRKTDAEIEAACDLAFGGRG